MPRKAIAKKDSELAGLARQANAEHRACEDGVRDGVCHALEAGRALTEAKAKVKHGEWLPWLAENFEGAERTARWYMEADHAATLTGVNRQELADLPLSEVLALLFPKQLTGPGPRDCLTGDPEWYTPKAYIEAARKAMGSIDLDPASCKLAQKTVRAKKYYGKGVDGLQEPWYGNVFLNPPYKAQDVAAFAGKLCDDVQTDNVKQAVLLTNNATDTQWWHRAARECSLACLTEGRINFENAEGEKKNPPNGHSFFYFGNRMKSFAKQFSDIGVIIRVESVE